MASHRMCSSLTLTNSVDPDEMQHYAAFHLGLHCLQKYLFSGFPNTKGYLPFLIFIESSIHLVYAG